MELSTFNIVEKLGSDTYSLWTGKWPRTKIHEIRQEPPVVEGDMARVFDEITPAGSRSKSVCNIILPDSKELKLFRVDMGEEFMQRMSYNGTTTQGTKTEIMAALQAELHSRGYTPRPNAYFHNVDVLATLQKIVDQNTDFYRTDFEYDRAALTKAAESRNGNHHFLWLSRQSGTVCYPERDVYIRNTAPHNSWTYYGGSKSDHVKAFWVQVNTVTEGKVMGDIAEMDYEKHLDHLCTESFDPVEVAISFKDPFYSRTFPYKEYNENQDAIFNRYGAMTGMEYQVEHPQKLDYAILRGQNLIIEAAYSTDIDSYVKLMEHDRLHDFGYENDDLSYAGPLDAELAVKSGLVCYALSADGSKEPVSNMKAINDHIYNSGIFGMTSSEKEFLQYFRQESAPMFTAAEMKELYSLAVQAGMNGIAENMTVLDNVIHKLECVMPQIGTEESQIQEDEYSHEA
ncbi:MAG: hypothetical protein RR142_05920 [Clostridia bacterium]